MREGGGPSFSQRERVAGATSRSAASSAFVRPRRSRAIVIRDGEMRAGLVSARSRDFEINVIVLGPEKIWLCHSEIRMNRLEQNSNVPCFDFSVFGVRRRAREFASEFLVLLIVKVQKQPFTWRGRVTCVRRMRCRRKNTKPYL